MHPCPRVAGVRVMAPGGWVSPALRAAPPRTPAGGWGVWACVPVHVCYVSVPFSAASVPWPVSWPSLPAPSPPRRACCSELGACASVRRGWRGPLTECRVLPRSAPVPVHRGAVPVRGSVCREERGSRVCVPARVSEGLQPRVRQRRGHLRQRLRAGVRGLRPRARDPGGSQRTLRSVAGKGVLLGAGVPVAMVMEPPPQTAVGSATLEPCARLRPGAACAPRSV